MSKMDELVERSLIEADSLWQQISKERDRTAKFFKDFAKNNKVGYDKGFISRVNALLNEYNELIRFLPDE